MAEPPVAVVIHMRQGLPAVLPCASIEEAGRVVTAIGRLLRWPAFLRGSMMVESPLPVLDDAGVGSVPVRVMSIDMRLATHAQLMRVSQLPPLSESRD